MKKIHFLFLLLVLGTAAQAQQVLFSEGFDGSTYKFKPNAEGVGLGSGNNMWVVNNMYNGGGIYKNTPTQDSTVSGSIGGAPYSNYLHVSSTKALVGTNNCNWDTASKSDWFAYSSFCTAGMKDIKISFYW